MEGRTWKKEVVRLQVVPSMWTLMATHRRSSGVVTFCSRVAWTPGWDALERSPKGVADAVMSVGHPAPAVESMQGVLCERGAGPLVGLVALYDPHRPRGVSRTAVARAVALPLLQRHWTTTPEFAHEDERTWAARKLSC
jgi:hypothetical protein